MIRGRNGETNMDVGSKVRGSTLVRAYESYANPRLSDEGVRYLTPEHRDQIRRDSEIVVWDEYARPKNVPGVGRIRRIGIQTAQGYTYDTLVGIPETPETAVPVIGTTAWTTSLRGHNERTVRNLMRAGNYVFYVGHEGSYVADEPPEPHSPISLANSAGAVLNFSYHMGLELRKAGYDVDETLRLGLGESRGAMVGEGLDALAADFAQDILFIDEVAPCLPEKLDSMYDVMKLAEQVCREPNEMRRLVGKLTLRQLWYYPKTIDIRRDCLRHQVIIGGALFSGETGALSRHVPGNTLKHISVFDNDFASMTHVWESTYGDNPFVRLTPLTGSHMTIADPETLRYVLARNKVAQACINTSKSFTPENVFDPAHELALRQFPISPEDMRLTA